MCGYIYICLPMSPYVCLSMSVSLLSYLLPLLVEHQHGVRGGQALQLVGHEHHPLVAATQTSENAVLKQTVAHGGVHCSQPTAHEREIRDRLETD